MSLFLLVYDRLRGELLELLEFEDTEDERDATAFLRREREEQYSDSPNIEVVTLSARDKSWLRSTHGRYFLSSEDLDGEVVVAG